MRTPDKALRHVESALASDPADPTALQELSLVHEALGQVSEALQVAPPSEGGDGTASNDPDRKRASKLDAPVGRGS